MSVAEKINIDDFELIDALINDGCVDLETLQSMNLFTPTTFNYLYISDQIKLTELADYWSLSKQAVHKKYKLQISERTQLLKAIENKFTVSITLCPQEIFENPDDYAIFLKWRSDTKNDLGIPVTRAAEILGINRTTLYRDIKGGKIQSYEHDNNQKIIKSSFKYYAEKYAGKIQEEIKTRQKVLERIKRFLDHDAM